MAHYFATAKEMEHLDRTAVAGGLEIRQMMELAGWNMVTLFTLQKIGKKKQIVVVIGKGNKGGDGLSAARHLVNHGYENVQVVFLSKNMSSDAQHHYALLKKMKVSLLSYETQKQQAMNAIGSADIIIDALIGYHLKGSPYGLFKEVIELVNASPAMVIAYDLPSGVEARTGACLAPCIEADITLCLALFKKAFQTKEGIDTSGHVYLADLGIPAYLYDKIKKGSRPSFYIYPQRLIPLKKY